MQIRRADELTWSPSPRCPVCGVGISASGNGEPFLVDGPQVYCRDDAARLDADYADALAEYRRWRLAAAEYRAWSDSLSG